MNRCESVITSVLCEAISGDAEKSLAVEKILFGVFASPPSPLS